MSDLPNESTWQQILDLLARWAEIAFSDHPFATLGLIVFLAVETFIARDALPYVLRAFRVSFRHWLVFALLAIGLAVPATLLRDGSIGLFQGFISGWLPAHGVVIDSQQAPLFAMMLSDFPVMAWSCVVGAFAAAVVIRIYLQDSEGNDVSLGDAVNFGLARWRRVIVPYTLMVVFIWIGSIVIIPGILYTLFWAFVPAVAVLDPEVRQVLRRSSLLTRGRRGRIFRTYLLFIPWWGWYATLGPFILLNTHWGLRHVAATCNEFLGFVIAMALLQLYLERMREVEALLAKREAEKAGALKRKNPITVH